MAPSLQAIPDPLHGYVFLSADWTEAPAVTFVRIVRIDSGTLEETVVRTHTFSDTSGEYIELSDGAIIVYDTEAPLDRPITYRAEGLGSALTATSGEIWLASTGELWLKDPLHPACNMRLHLKQQANSPSCEPGHAKFFIGLDAETHPSRGSLVEINNAKFPVPANRVRGSLTSTLNIVTRTIVDREDVTDILAPGTDLLLQAPEKYDVGNRYMSVAAPTYSRVLPDHRIPWRTISMPHTEVESPPGLNFGVAGTRWLDACSTCSTFLDLTWDDVTWEQVMMGLASAPENGPTVGWLTYGDVLGRYADYADVYDLGARSYLELLMGT